MKLEELVKELLNEGLYCDDVSYNPEIDSLCYRILGFAKSGSGTLQNDKDGKIHLITRYNQDNIIYSIEDIISVAYSWDRNYCCKDSLYSSYGVSNNWKALYIKYGYNVSNFN